MSIEGQVKNGVVLLPEGVTLAEGSVVRVEPVPQRAEVATPAGSPRSILSRLADIAGQFPVNPDLPTDLAAQHDHYLYGTPKRP